MASAMGLPLGSRTWRGLTTTTGSAAAARAATNGTSRPPVASSNRRDLYPRSGKPPRCRFRCKTRPISVPYRTATSTCAFETSMPMYLGFSSICTSCVSAGPSLHDTGSIGPGNCSGSACRERGDPRYWTVCRDPGNAGLPRSAPSPKSRYKGFRHGFPAKVKREASWPKTVSCPWGSSTGPPKTAQSSCSPGPATPIPSSRKRRWPCEAGTGENPRQPHGYAV